jgi:hypothetical protein
MIPFGFGKHTTLLSIRSLTTAFMAGAVLCAAVPDARATRFAGEFMAMGGGARALGMGGAFCAVANDASAVYWNPAGISGLESREALFMHSERFGNLVNYNFAAYTNPTTNFVSTGREAAFGFALIHLGVDDIPVTKDLQYEENNNIPGFQPEDGDRLLYNLASLPKESNNDFALLTTFAMKTTRGRVGASLKLLYTNSIAGYSSTGIGLDLGFIRRDILPNFDVGAKLQDITGTYMSWSSGTNEFIAPSVTIGGAYHLVSAPLNGALMLAADGHFYFEDRRGGSQFWMDRYSADLHIGTEIVFQEKVMVRGGFDAGNPTAGAGFRLGFLGFDYAYLHHDDFDATHRISALVDF